MSSFYELTLSIVAFKSKRDVSFMVERRNIFAHKVILAQHSGYFDGLFSNNSIQVNAFEIRLLQIINTGIQSTL